MELLVQNLTCVFQRFNSNFINYNSFRDLVSGDTPQIIDLGEPGAPLIVRFARTGVEIVQFDNRLQISLRAPEIDNFPVLSRKVLEAIGEQLLDAYGSNFEFRSTAYDICKVLKVGRVFPTDEFERIQSVTLVFKRAERQYTINLAPYNRPANIHVNVHHQEAISTSDLAGKILEIYKSDLEGSKRLVGEVIGNVEIDST